MYSFFCAMVAAVTLRFLDPFGSGKLVLFQVTYDKDWHAYELFPFLILGVLGVSDFTRAYTEPFVIVISPAGCLRCILLKAELSLEPPCTQRHMAQELPCHGSHPGQ